MAQPKTGGRTTRSQAAAGATDSGIKKTPGGRVGDKANKLGEGQKSTAGESQPAQPEIEDVAMGEAPSIKEPTDSVSGSPAQPHPSTEPKPAQSTHTLNQSTPISDEETLHSDPEVDFLVMREITNRMESTKIEDDGRLVGLIKTSNGHFWKLMAYGPPQFCDYEMLSFLSTMELKKARAQRKEGEPSPTDGYRQLDKPPLNARTDEQGNSIKHTIAGFRAVAVKDGDILSLVPKDGEKWPPQNIRILVKWEIGKNQTEKYSWEKYNDVEKAWKPGSVPCDKRIKIRDLVTNGKKNKLKEKAILIKEDITMNRRAILETGQELTELQWMLIGTAIRCYERNKKHSAGLPEGGKKDIAARYATPALDNGDKQGSSPIKSEGTTSIASGTSPLSNRDEQGSSPIKSEGTRFIASKDAMESEEEL